MKGDSSKNKTILVIEDEPAMLEVLADTLISEGFDVLKARSGEEGLKFALKEHPDLILLDLILPKMNGMTMLRKLRKDDWGSNVQVVILTNLSAIEKTAEALESKVYDYLVKTNWRLEDIVKKVKERLEVK